MKNVNWKKVQPFGDIILGILYLLCTTLEYLPYFNAEDSFHLGDWCFITGMIGGTIFIISGILEFKNKETSTFLQFYNTTLLCLILLGTIAIGLNFSGYLWFIHIIGPVLVLFRFFTYYDCRKINKPSKVLLLGLAPFLYVTFTFIMLVKIGKCPFPARMLFNYSNFAMTYGMTLLLVIIMWCFGYTLFFINRGVNKRRDKKREVTENKEQQ